MTTPEDELRAAGTDPRKLAELLIRLHWRDTPRTHVRIAAVEALDVLSGQLNRYKRLVDDIRAELDTAEITITWPEAKP